MSGFTDLLQKVKAGSSVDFERLAVIYQGMIRNASFVEGRYDEDLHQELLMVLYTAAIYFKIVIEKSNM